MKKLPHVTIVAYDDFNADRIVSVMNYCSSLFEFGAVKLWSYEGAAVPNHGLVVPTTFKGYIGSLHQDVLGFQIETSHCLFVSHDGFPINPEAWDDSWLQYDYIGAPWPAHWCHDYERYQVGNSGLSLRSKRFMEVSSQHYHLYDPKQVPSDAWICRNMRETFESDGIKYAPIEVADQFSWEAYNDGVKEKSFGFHGKHAYGNDYKAILDRAITKNLI